MDTRKLICIGGLALALSACGGDEESPDPPGGGGGSASLSLTVDGEALAFTEVTAEDEGDYVSVRAEVGEVLTEEGQWAFSMTLSHPGEDSLSAKLEWVGQTAGEVGGKAWIPNLGLCAVVATEAELEGQGCALYASKREAKALEAKFVVEAHPSGGDTGPTKAIRGELSATY